MATHLRKWMNVWILVIRNSIHFLENWFKLQLYAPIITVCYYYFIFCQVSALYKTKGGAIKNFRRLRNHQVHFESFSQRHLEQLLHKTLHVCDFAAAPTRVHDVVRLRGFRVRDRQTSVVLFVVLVLWELVGSWHPFQFQPVLSWVAQMRTCEALGCSVGEALAEINQECSPGTKEVSCEGSHWACA